MVTILGSRAPISVPILSSESETKNGHDFWSQGPRFRDKFELRSETKNGHDLGAQGPKSEPTLGPDSELKVVSPVMPKLPKIRTHGNEKSELAAHEWGAAGE